MKAAFIFEIALLSAGLVAANGRKTLTHPDIRRAAALFSRQTSFCSTGNTCAECFGEGNIPCEGDYCYNPDAGEQCCADGTYCIGSDASCCDSGAGVPGTAETTFVPTPTSRSSPSSIMSSPPTQSSGSDSDWECDASDTNEECCKKGGSTYSYCPGGDTTFQILCYDPAAGETCCNDGTSCSSGEDCCGAAGVNTSPLSNPEATSRVLSSRTGISLNTGAPTQRITTGGASGPTAATTTTNVPPVGAANTRGAMEGAAAVAIGALGLVLL